ncbi:MAG: superoxide dismutase [Fe] [Legionellales bacterium]|jgi:Fe-Mn family superoxide dismutase|nr:superoxide dismutase [Fe] [Legionellales bacterium]|tara:strand:- start:510 stop:1097 length:588 start_codon:yes stop_codon:yes gene_type:complete
MHTQPELPYRKDALAPYISEKTMDYHYGKHHKGYFDKLNALIVDTPFAQQSLVEIVRSSDGALFNNAAQAWNHILYWDSMSPKTGQMPTGELLNAITRDFGGVDELKSAFTTAALNTFGSGWAWLVINSEKKLAVVSTSNAHNPLEMPGTTPLLACDVWEHAYYLDTQNNRASYLDHFWTVCNWEYVHEQLLKST